MTISINEVTDDNVYDKSAEEPIVDRKKQISLDQAEMSELDFDKNLDNVQKMLETLEKQFLMDDFDYDEAVQWHLGDNMQHSYYLDTVTAIKTTRSCFFDMFLIIFTYVWIMAGLHLLREKNYIGNYHAKWTVPTKF